MAGAVGGAVAVFLHDVSLLNAEGVTLRLRVHQLRPCRHQIDRRVHLLLLNIMRRARLVLRLQHVRLGLQRLCVGLLLLDLHFRHLLLHFRRWRSLGGWRCHELVWVGEAEGLNACPVNRNRVIHRRVRSL